MHIKAAWELLVHCPHFHSTDTKATQRTPSDTWPPRTPPTGKLPNRWTCLKYTGKPQVASAKFKQQLQVSWRKLGSRKSDVLNQRYLRSGEDWNLIVIHSRARVSCHSFIKAKREVVLLKGDTGAGEGHGREHVLLVWEERLEGHRQLTGPEGNTWDQRTQGWTNKLNNTKHETLVPKHDPGWERGLGVGGQWRWLWPHGVPRDPRLAGSARAGLSQKEPETLQA